MPPPQAGEISMYMHSGERQQPLPYQVPAISSGESSLASFLLGRSCPWLMGAASSEFGFAWSLLALSATESTSLGQVDYSGRLQARMVDVGPQHSRTLTGAPLSRVLLRGWTMAHDGTCSSSGSSRSMAASKLTKRSSTESMPCGSAAFAFEWRTAVGRLS